MSREREKRTAKPKCGQTDTQVDILAGWWSTAASMSVSGKWVTYLQAKRSTGRGGGESSKGQEESYITAATLKEIACASNKTGQSTKPPQIGYQRYMQQNKKRNKKTGLGEYMQPITPPSSTIPSF